MSMRLERTDVVIDHDNFDIDAELLRDHFGHLGPLAAGEIYAAPNGLCAGGTGHYGDTPVYWILVRARAAHTWVLTADIGPMPQAALANLGAPLPEHHLWH